MCLAGGRQGPMAVQIVGDYGLVWSIPGETAAEQQLSLDVGELRWEKYHE